MRLKAVAGADWLINMIGFGMLTPYAGWALTMHPLTDAGAWALGGFAPLFAALYPLTQLYQLEAGPRARRSHARHRTRGAKQSCDLRCCRRRSPSRASRARRSLRHRRIRRRLAQFALIVAACAWLAVLGQWIVRAPAMLPAAHKRGMYAALGAWALTDLAVLLAVAP